MDAIKHVFLAFKIVFALVLTALAVRAVTMPEPFGSFGVYREATMDYWMNERPVEFVGNKTCNEAGCHRNEAGQLVSSRHRDIACESCHAMTVGRVPEKTIDCLLCHRKLVARPDNFPQVVEGEHYAKDSQKCTSCHDPHAPIPMMSHPMPVTRKGRQGCLVCHLKASGDVPDLPDLEAVSEFEYLFKPPGRDFDHGGKRDCITCHTSTPSLAELATMVHGKDISYCPRCHRSGGLAQGDFR